jgi:TonB family protein
VSALPQLLGSSDDTRQRLPSTGTEGSLVKLQLTIDAEGHVTSARGLETRSDALTSMAITIARRLRFRPAYKDGQPVATEIPFSIWLE